jgi:16S rRNA (cytosine1402-N4)-methyltransferase
MDALREMLDQTPEMIYPEGRLVILTYHSLEDRDVKNFIKAGNYSGKTESDVFGRVIGLPFKAVNKKVIVPNENEITNNSRARSAKLRIAERNE